MKLTDPVIGGGPRVRADYIAHDSFGVKGLCTRVITPDLALTIDPGASLEARSFPLPEPERNRLLDEHLAACRDSCADSKVLVISHYHLDHFLAGRDTEAYGDRVLFLKSTADLPPKQVSRADKLLRSIDGLPAETITADGREFKFGRTRVSFSAPVWHGTENADPGTVIMTTVRRGKEAVLITSDVCGPTERATTDLICESKAHTVILDGYPTYHLGQFATDHDLVRSIINVCRILSVRELKTLVIDHHMARDYRYPAFFRLAYAKAKRLGRAFGTAAELLGRTSAVLRGYQDFGPTKWHHWFPLERDDARAVLERAVTAGRVDKDWLTDFDRWVD